MIGESLPTELIAITIIDSLYHDNYSCNRMKLPSTTILVLSFHNTVTYIAYNKAPISY